MSASRQVNRKGEKPASSPNLDAELLRLKSAARRAPTEADAPQRVYGTWPVTGTAIQLPTCPACGGSLHQGGIAACPDVREVEFDSYGHVRRIVKR